MEIVKKEQVRIVELSSACVVQEYDIHDKDLNIAVAEINGRYPQEGWVVNRTCKELAFVVTGSGTITIEDQQIELKEGDSILIHPHEKYFWQGTMKLILPCAPAWHAEQHKNIKE